MGELRIRTSDPPFEIVQLCLNHPGLQLDTLSPPETHFWIQVYIIACINTGCTMRHRLKPSCQNKNKNLTGGSEFTLKSLLPVNWQQRFNVNSLLPVNW